MYSNWFLLPFVLFFLFIFILLPTHCSHDDYTLYNHCHRSREMGINCMPDDNCWYNNHHMPGPYGFMLLVFFIGIMAFCFLLPDTYSHATDGFDYSPRKRRFI